MITKSQMEKIYAEKKMHSKEQIEDMSKRVLKVIYYIQTNPLIKAGTYDGDLRYLEYDSNKAKLFEGKH